mgnify:CR=1 FL=1
MSHDADKISDMVKRVVKAIFCLDGKEVTRETNFREDLIADTLDMVDVIMEVEYQLNALSSGEGVIIIPEELCDKISTVGDLIDAAKKVMGV